MLEYIQSIERAMEECVEQLKQPGTDRILTGVLRGRLFALRLTRRMATEALERWK